MNEPNLLYHTFKVDERMKEQGSRESFCHRTKILNAPEGVAPC